MAVYTIIDQSTCIACGMCGVCADKIYDYDDEGIAYVVHDNNSGTIAVNEADEDDVIDAQMSCPSDSVKVATCSFEGNPERFS
ncbi:ferredoxin [Brochothrix campestris]|uniref:Ferredoxin n=1 Tax=Brochothrix campestris FSL F6-1037 TaxID=1265861 RepID=W7CXC2_9LIST|nr:ferredoxin [Brochothrix campestris]EUJ41622.1 ferredoxin [Brochothrix campestris FSL F6-1037]